MAALKKIILTPYFGELPEWMNKFEPPVGYTWLLDTDLEQFKKRVKDKLGFDYPGLPGTGKVWDYRCALGFLYEEEIEGFDYWSHMDFDMVFGNVDKWFPDEKLKELDIWSNHDTYVCGCWSLYRNCKEVNELFFLSPEWKEQMTTPDCTGWVEKGYSRLLEQSGLRYKYSFHQGDPYNPPFNLKKVDGKLFQNDIEIPMLHFRRTKKFPL